MGIGPQPGTYTNATVVVDATGVISFVSSGSVSPGGITQLTSDVTAGPGSGSQAATIANGVVSTAKMGGDVTTAGKALLDDADAAAQRTTLGLGTAATANTGDFDAAGAAAAAVVAHVALPDPHTQYLTAAEGNAAYDAIGAAAAAQAASASLIHATRHQAGGLDPIALDTLAAPTDVTTLDASTSAHGLMQKYPGGTTNFLRADGAFAAPVAAAGDFSWRITSNTSIATDKTRSICGVMQVEADVIVTVEADGVMATF